MIQIKSISKAFDGKTVLKDVSFTVNEGECVALTGESGAGKTTLMRIIAGLEQPDSGEIIFNKSVRASYVFQENRLLENKSALENILCVAPDKKRAEYFLDRCGLSADRDKRAGKLSGGMKRRLAIARALAYGGELYYLDEPLRELDGDTMSTVAELIKEEIKGKTAILITHDSSALEILADRCVDVRA